MNLDTNYSTMKKGLLFLLTTFSILTFSCSNAQQQDEKTTIESKKIVKDIDAAEFNKQISSEKDIQILDVRTTEEVAQGKIPNAINIDFYNNFDKNIASLDKSKPVYVYCAAGGRSAKAMNILHEHGFVEIYNLKGGFGAWSQNNFPIEK